MQTELSPAARAVLDAACDAWYINDHPRSISAAALRVAAEHVHYKDRLGWSGYGYHTEFKHQILAIAAELEGAQ